MGGNLKTRPGLAKLNHVTGRRPGGTRTPFTTRWPGRIKPGVSDEVVSMIDLAASFAALTDQTLPATGCPDSSNVLGAEDRNQLLQQGNDGDNLGLRFGDWKLIRMKKTARLRPLSPSILPHCPPAPMDSIFYRTTPPSATMCRPGNRRNSNDLRI